MNRMTAAEIRQTLQTDHGYTKEQAKDITGIANLRQELNKAMYQIQDLDEIEEVLEEGDDATKKVANFPIAKTDPRWSDFVMGQFEPDELYNGNPTVDGLRRVAELVLGPISHIESTVVQSPTLDNQKRATVEVRIIIGEVGDDNYQCVCGAADSYYGNTERVYRNYPVSQAETRAEGRALKRALRLKKVNAAEEISEEIDDNLDDGIQTDVEMVTDGQITFIETRCRKLNISVKEFINQEGPRHSIKETVRSEAAVAIKLLNTYQQNPDEIPPEVVGFDPEWRSEYE